jgi:hypothetical protein
MHIFLLIQIVTLYTCCATCGDDRSFKVWNLKDNTLLYLPLQFTPTPAKLTAMLATMCIALPRAFVKQPASSIKWYRLIED